MKLINFIKRTAICLYLVLVACVFCGLKAQSQDATMVINYYDVDTLKIEKPPLSTLPIIFQLIVQYRDECYADSTAEYYWTLCDWDCWIVPCEKLDTNLMGGKCPEYWTHKEPTFADFIDWFSKKYGY